MAGKTTRAKVSVTTPEGRVFCSNSMLHAAARNHERVQGAAVKLGSGSPEAMASARAAALKAAPPEIRNPPKAAAPAAPSKSATMRQALAPDRMAKAYEARASAALRLFEAWKRSSKDVNRATSKKARAAAREKQAALRARLDGAKVARDRLSDRFEAKTGRAMYAMARPNAPGHGVWVNAKRADGGNTLLNPRKYAAPPVPVRSKAMGAAAAARFAKVAAPPTPALVAPPARRKVTTPRDPALADARATEKVRQTAALAKRPAGTPLPVSDRAKASRDARVARLADRAKAKAAAAAPKPAESLAEKYKRIAAENAAKPKAPRPPITSPERPKDEARVIATKEGRPVLSVSAADRATARGLAKMSEADQTLVARATKAMMSRDGGGMTIKELERAETLMTKLGML